MINKGLDPNSVELVVTDMLPAYASVILTLFPNALHQFCIFHFIQHINSKLKEALKKHRHANFKVGERKEAHRISLLILKGQEKLTTEEQNLVFKFCEKYPTIAADYALKEDIRFLYANAQTEMQAILYRDIILDTYNHKISAIMEETLTWFQANFEKTIAYIKKGYFKDKTNNDAEILMRKIKKTQITHYFLRKDDTYITKIRTILGTHINIAT